MSGSSRLRDRLHRDAVLFVGLLAALILVLRAFVGDVLVPVLDAEGLLYGVWVDAVTVFGSADTLRASVVGVWAAIVVLWAVDTYKRPLVLLPLLLGPLCTLFLDVPATAFSGLLTPAGLVVFVLFGLVTLKIGGIGVIRYVGGARLVSTPPNEPIELRNGPRLLALGVALAAGAAVVDHHVTLTMADRATSSPTFWNAASGLAILGLLHPFVRYDERRRVVQIGPGRSGKTSTVGGMYCDVREGSGAPGENRVGRTLVGKQLQGISSRLTNSRSFPNQTQKTGAIPFDYFDSRRLFRRKNAMMTFDYEGQKLTGKNGPEESFSGRMETYRARQDGTGIVGRLRTRIERTLGLDVDPWYAEFTDGPGEPDIAPLLDSADTVVFTLPADDFLTPTFERGGPVPENAGIYLVEPVPSADEERYAVERPWGESFEAVRDDDGRIVHASHDQPVAGLSFDDFEELPLAPRSSAADAPKRRYTTDEPRDPITTYLDEYRRLIDLLWERESGGWFDSARQFVWVVTMSDLVRDEFREIYAEVQSTDENEGSGTLEFLRQNGLFARGEPAHFRRDYTLFGEWIVEECIQRHIMRARESKQTARDESLPDVDSLIDRTGEDTVYPVWFDVTRTDGRLTIENTDGRLLKGSNFLFDRIERRPLPYPTNRRFKTSRVQAVYQQLNPIVEPAGKPLYASAIEEMERHTDTQNDGGMDGSAVSSTPPLQPDDGIESTTRGEDE